MLSKLLREISAIASALPCVAPSAPSLAPGRIAGLSGWKSLPTPE